MKKLSAAFIFVPMAIGISFAALAQTTFNPPATPANPFTDTLHGMYVTDNYRWLEDKENEQVTIYSDHLPMQCIQTDKLPTVSVIFLFEVVGEAGTSAGGD